VIDWLAPAGVFLLVDQWSKKMVESHVADRSVSWRLLRIRRVRTLRNIYGRTGPRAALVLLWCAALVSAIILYRAGAGFQSHTALIGLGSAFGGAAGNLLDILRRRSIVDFIDLRWGPVFNVADVAITGGLILAFWPRS
jgi:signal peptidase II